LGGHPQRRLKDHGGYLTMMAHELLRNAALILGAGWSKGCDARDSAGRMVPLYVGAALILGAAGPKDAIPRIRAPTLMRTP
jgi:hypothetical protein